MVYTLSAIIESGLFDINYHNDFLSTMRDYRATTIYYEVDGKTKKIFLDFWEYQAPTHTTEVFKSNYDLIIKLQHVKFAPEQYVFMCRSKNTFVPESDVEIKNFLYKIVPWSFFPSRMMEQYIGKESLLWDKEVKIDGFFCGKDWRCRRNFKKWVVENKMDYWSSKQDEKDGIVMGDTDYIEKMKSSKFGLVAAGRGSWATEGKNRREIDYMMMKKPLLLNYKPNYYFPMVEGEHYIYWSGEKLSDIEKKYDIDKIAENGYQWYLKYARKDALGFGFKKILDDKFCTNSV